MTYAALLGAVELGMIYAILALGVFLSFRTLNTPDLTVDGSIVTGAAASAMICSLGGNPILALAVSFVLGSLAGVITALLNTKLKIQPILAGILVML
ncbi:MAG: ABC transporter permease, partial [Peptostreptococcaceae bacterium]|nr:ABC transporter permease [Peptostreptococcaceae bacterium]